MGKKRTETQEEKIAHYRKLAKSAKDLAEEATDEKLREALLKTARRWAEVADEAEKELGKKKK